MVRRFLKIRSLLIYGCAFLWAFQFSFGAFFHYHPEYTHGHSGALETHHHGGHFHSLELERLAAYFHPGYQPLAGGETHHHSENLPGNDPESAQYDFGSSGLPEISLILDQSGEALPVSWPPEEPDHVQTLSHASDTHRILFLPSSPAERAPPVYL